MIPNDFGANRDLALTDFEPKSMLRVSETRVSQPRFPVIDFHTHLTWGAGMERHERLTILAETPQLIPVMDAKNIRMLINLTGGYGEAVSQAIRIHQGEYPDRFAVFVEPWWSKTADPGYARFQANEIAASHKAGARGLKILKTLGLFLREQITSGSLIRVDDRRFDLMWETAGALRMPVAIHVSDPRAFFFPADRFNERWEELNAHPDWSFHGAGFPSNYELQEARRRVMKRHPQTQFVCLHVADAEDLDYVSECMDSHPNMYVDIAARINELGRQPRASRRFFDKYQDRILFGTDAIPGGFDVPQQIFGEELYEIYYRFLETKDEYFDYAPTNIPPQGRWRIAGIGLPEPILEKVYWKNASRLLNLTE